MTVAAEEITVRNPASGAVLATVPTLDRSAVGALVSAAREAQPAWAGLGFSGRRAALDRLRHWLLEHRGAVIETIVSETGKAYEDAQLLELSYAVSALSFWSRHAEKMLEERRFRARTPLTPGRVLLTRYVPRGVVGVIGPWNFPLLNSFGDCIPALAAGNSVVLKPSELTPLTSLLMARAAAECDIPSGVFAVATGAGETGAALVELADFIMFTGSTATGREVARAAAGTLTPVSLELGGKDALIVLEGADLERAANLAVFYGMINAGQTCVSIERVYVQASVHDELLAKLETKVRALRTGEPHGPGSIDIGAITTEAQLETIEAHVADAVAKGARVLTGGSRRPGAGRFFEPTVLANVDHTMRCMVDETFGPTLPVMAVEDEDDAVMHVNDSRYGLGAAVFAADAQRGEAVARRLEVGAVCVNDAGLNYFALEAPMGGVKESGLGRRHGPGGIRKYASEQTIMLTPTWMPRREPQTYPYARGMTAVLARVLSRIYGRR